MIEKVTVAPAYPPAGGLAAWIGPGLAQVAFLGGVAVGALALTDWLGRPLPGALACASLCLSAALLWGFGNDFEPKPPAWYGAIYHTGRPAWYVLAAWYLRNPFQNAGRYGFGVSHRTRTVIGPAPALSTHPREDVYNAGGDPSSVPGWKWHVLYLGPWFPIPLPFVSYWSERWKFYAGWQHNGFFGFKVNARFLERLNLW